MSIARTIFVSIVVGAGAIYFTKDIEELIITPIENMLKKINRITENPLEAA